MDGYFGRFPAPGRVRQPYKRNPRMRPPRQNGPYKWNTQFQGRGLLRYPPPSAQPYNSNNNRKNLKITANILDTEKPKSNPRDVFKRLGKPVDQSPSSSLHETTEMEAAYLMHKEKLKHRREQNSSSETQVVSADKQTCDDGKNVDDKKKVDDEKKVDDTKKDVDGRKNVDVGKKVKVEEKVSILKKEVVKSESTSEIKDLSLLAHYLLHRRTLKSKPDTAVNVSHIPSSEATSQESDNASVVDMEVSEVNESTADEAAPVQVPEVNTKDKKPEDENPAKAGGRHVEKDNSEDSRHLLITTHFEEKTIKNDTPNTEIPPENRSSNPDASWYCVVCNKDVTGEKITHYREENHKKNKKLARPHCDICDQWFNRPCQLIQHVKSKEHKAKVKEIRPGESSSDLTPVSNAEETALPDSQPVSGEPPTPKSAAPQTESSTVSDSNSSVAIGLETPEKENVTVEAGASNQQLGNKAAKPPMSADEQESDPPTAKDMPHIIPVAGYYCEVCCDFFFDEDSTLKHCRTKQHLQKIKTENGENWRTGSSASPKVPSSGAKTRRRRKSSAASRSPAVDKKQKIAPPGGATVLSPKSDLGVPRKTITTDVTTPKAVPHSPRNTSSDSVTSRKHNVAPPIDQVTEGPKPLSRNYVIPKRNKVS